MDARKSAGISVPGILLLLALIAAGGGYWYYQKQQKAAAAQAGQFITERVRRGDIIYEVSASGMVYPKKTVKVGAQVSGEISKLAVEIGDVVKEGDLIAEIDARTQENAKRSAEAQLDGQKAALSTAKSTLDEAQLAYNRAERLLKSGAGTQEVRDSAYTALVSAKNAVTTAEANIRQSELTISTAEIDLSRARVYAPINGTVLSLAVEEGQAVNAVQDTPTLVTLAPTDVMTVKAEIAEADVSVMKNGLPATFTLLGKNTGTFQGTLERIDPAPKEISDSSSLTSSTAIYYYGHIDVANRDNLLRYGMTATVSITVDKAENVLIIPMTALTDKPDGTTAVNVLVDSQPQERIVKTGLDDSVNIEIVEGLDEGDEVVISTAGKGRDFKGPPGMF